MANHEPVSPSRHGGDATRATHPLPGAGGGRFERLFGFLPERDPGAAAIDALVEIVRANPPTSNSLLPAGFTYLGQFIDHDITFDPGSRLHRANDPRSLVNFRTPRLDLDSVYGTGPADQPFLYDWEDATAHGVKLLARRIDAPSPRFDVPRNHQGRAVIGDARNDENAIVAQLHALFIGFHNAVVDELAGGRRALSTRALLQEARRIVRWHYQWIVVHDYLRRVVGAYRATSVLREGHGSAPVVTRRFYRWRRAPAIPVEFSAAAFRFGHSMVRASYRIRPGAVATLFPPGDVDLHGFDWIHRERTIDWPLFFWEYPHKPPGANNSMSIDAALVAPLFALPPDIARDHRELARLNLERGRALGLPAGPDVARAMSEPVLGTADLLPSTSPAASLPDATRDAIEHATPLWYYVLCEAAKPGDLWGGSGGGRQLGPVGGRIVAEVLVGLLEADPSSYLRQWPTWKPELKRASDGEPGDFTMVDLVAYVARHQAARS